MIHPLSPGYHRWDRPGIQNLDRIHWPSESGGLAVLRRIFERCAEMRQPGYREDQHERVARITDGVPPSSDPKDWYRANADPVLYELMEPERGRQKGEMLRAIDRVCLLLEKAGKPPG